MTELQREFMILAGKYSEKLDKTPWWKFIKRRRYKKLMDSALECYVLYP